MVWFLCVHSPLPDPWLSWALMWTSFLHEDPNIAGPTLGGNDSAVNTDGYLGCSSSLSHWLVLFFFLPWEEQVQCCHHVSVYKYKDAWLWFSWYLYCCADHIMSDASHRCGLMFKCRASSRAYLLFYLYFTKFIHKDLFQIQLKFQFQFYFLGFKYFQYQFMFPNLIPLLQCA